MARDVSTLKIELAAEDKASGVIAGVGNTIKTGLIAAVGVATGALASLAVALRSAIPAAILRQSSPASSPVSSAKVISTPVNRRPAAWISRVPA